VKPIAVFVPSIPDIGTIVHVGDHDIGDAVINLRLRLFHGLACPDDDERDTGIPGDKPFIIKQPFLVFLHSKSFCIFVIVVVSVFGDNVKRSKEGR
jgi:hypothetical protein